MKTIIATSSDSTRFLATLSAHIVTGLTNPGKTNDINTLANTAVELAKQILLKAHESSDMPMLAGFEVKEVTVTK